jgi:CHASE2 domain-containing sensor protein
MVETITLQESLGFSAFALLFALITMRLRPELRRSALVTLLIIALGLGGLVLLLRVQLIPAHLAIAVIPRELCLLIVALGNIRIYIRSWSTCCSRGERYRAFLAKSQSPFR